MLGRALIKRALLTGNLCPGVNPKSFDPSCNILLVKTLHCNSVNHAQQSKKDLSNDVITILGRDYNTDLWSNVTPNIVNNIGRNLHLQKDHPICLIKEAIVQHFYASYRTSTGPVFAVSDNLSPVVTTQQNFDSMLIPKDHETRKKSDNYYVNERYILRAHTSAHEDELIRCGLNAFLIVGDVYRRDSVDATHFPIFHQMEGVRLFNEHQLFSKSDNSDGDLRLFENDFEDTIEKQSCHTMEAAKLVEYDLKHTLEKCLMDIFGPKIEFRWVDAYFPFTHPSFELEIKIENEWIEMLGCGVLRQEILNNAGAGENIAWAFGLGLERLAMKLFNIPDIRYFWTKDEAFLSQFRGHNSFKDIKFKPMISAQPSSANDISFWINQEDEDEEFSCNDFNDIVRSVDKEGIVESVSLIDEFTHPKTKRKSRCYRIYYRHVSRPLTQSEVNQVHDMIQKTAVANLNIEGRW